MFELIKIEDLDLQVIDGDRGKNYPHKEELMNEGDCLFLSANNVTASGFLFSDVVFISAEKDNILKSGKLLRDDIVITTRGTVGNVAYYNNDVPYNSIRINSGMLIIRCRNAINAQYVYYVLKSQWFKQCIEQIKTGSAQPQLPKSHFLKMEIPVPDLSTQNKIVNILSCIEQKIYWNMKINNNLPYAMSWAKHRRYQPLGACSHKAAYRQCFIGRMPDSEQLCCERSTAA
ncbi:MAG: restriction endonuclease subunit S [Clostridiales bacterium]|nr:restriction endonuclease subunit S [Clostridiales bacterium]